MLSLYTFTSYALLTTYAVFFSILFIILKGTNYSFYKVWVVFAYLLALSVVLGFCGEDFFTIVILSAEIPVFFAFFFFCVTKTQLGVDIKNRETNPQLYRIIATILATYAVIPCLVNGNKAFFYYLPEQLVGAAQRSDFFIFYVSFFLANPQFILFIGVLITAATFIILFFTFKSQIATASFVQNKKEVEWVRVQDTQMQTLQKRSFVFFKV